ncbi:MAG TPA: substrate-binding domain-containing protein [Polyangia bacterium]|jgi:molybdate-binding protein/DNA-binding XRE family transcriptional regulator
MRTTTALANGVGRRRGTVGLTQQSLAARIGVSRQSLSVIESGRSVPSAAVALRLARALGCTVEELFWIDAPHAPLTVALAPGEEPSVLVGGSRHGHRSRSDRSVEARVVLASVDERWVAHRLSAGDAGAFQTAADATLVGSPHAEGTARARPLGDVNGARDNLLCAGCAPAFGVLAARANVNVNVGGGRVVWIERSSGAALDLLANGLVHVAGAHLFDEASREFNVPFVRRRLPERSMLVFNLARWEAGLVVAQGNPRRIRGVRDLVRPEVSFVRRQKGAAAQELVERLLLREGLQASRLNVRAAARGHVEVARLIALGIADAGIAMAAVARAHQLDFIPLAEERFDLIVAKPLAADRRVIRLLETLAGRSFRREMDSLGGHVTRDSGRLIADTSLPQ